MSLRHGARKLLEQLAATENQALEALDEAEKFIRYNPDFSIRKIHEARRLIQEGARQRNEELPEQLQRAAPPLEQRLAELERQMTELRDSLMPRIERTKVEP